MDNHTSQPDELIEELSELSDDRNTSVATEYLGIRRSYTKTREIVRRDDGSVWALEFNQNEDHNYATDAYEVTAGQVTTTVYSRKG